MPSPFPCDPGYGQVEAIILTVSTFNFGGFSLDALDDDEGGGSVVDAAEGRGVTVPVISTL